MLGRARFASEKRAKILDPVEADPLMALLFMAAVVVSTYTTWYVGEYVLPHGANRSGAQAATGSAGSIASLDGIQDYVVAAVPFFFALMFVEGVLMWVQSFKPVAASYCAVDTWSSIACGTAQTLLQMLLKPYVPMTLAYCLVWDTMRVTAAFDDLSSWTVAAICFVAGDFAYYWFHRNAHEVHFMWAGHSVHHSGEHYNLSTALRQSWVQALLSGVYALPMALFLPPRAYMLAQQWVTLYQFWVHTCVVRRLPRLVELVMVTPSHHRMHHDRRLHKNFAGVFIVWDRIFGTFHDEFGDVCDPNKNANIHTDDFASRRRALAPTAVDNGGEELAYYGITDPIRSWADSVSQLLIWGKISSLVGRHGLVSIPRHVVFGPGWATSTKERPLPAVADAAVLRLRIDVSEIPLAAKGLVWALYVWTLQAFGVVVVNMGTMSRTQSSAVLLFTLWSLINQGFVFDRWRCAFASEALRCAVGVMCFWYLPFSYCAEWHLGLLASIVLLKRWIYP